MVLLVYYFFCFWRPVQKVRSDAAFIMSELFQFTQSDYVQRFQDVDSIFQRNETFRYLWEDYRKSLTRRVDEEGVHKIYSPANAEEFFSSSIIMEQLNIGFWQGFGGIFTGAGILGTFLGLTLGLNEVDLSSSDVNVLKDGISNLLTGISFAFFTSLVGIFIALLFGFCHNSITSRLTDDIHKLGSKIDEMYPRLTTEQWLADSFGEHQEQTRTLKNLSQDIAQQLGEVLDTQLSSGFDELCEKLDQQLKPVFDRLYEAINELNNGGASAIAGAMEDKAGQQIAAFASTLQEIQETMKQSVAASQQVSGESNRMLTATMETMRNALTQGAKDAADTQRETVEKLASQVQNIVDALNGSSEKAMGSLITASQSVQEQLMASMNGTRDMTTEIIKGFSSMSAQQQSMMEKSLQGTKEQLTSALKGNQKQMEDSLTKFQSILDEHNTAMEQTYNRLQILANAIETLLSEAKTAGNAYRDAAVPIQNASSLLKEQLEKTMEESTQIRNNLSKQIALLSSSNEKTNENMNKLMQCIQEAEQRSAEAWKRYEDNFSSISGELERTTDLITERLGKYNDMMRDGMRSHLSDFDNSIASATGALSSLVEDLNDAVEELTRKS